jgi:acetyl esterase
VPLDPQVEVMLDAMKAMGMDMFAGDVFSLTPEQLRQMSADRRVPAPVAEVAKTEDRVIDGPDGSRIPIRIYWPSLGDTLPIVVFFHGGGWVIGDIESHDGTVRSLTNLTGAIFVSVDYRLAPEHPFPAAPEDCYAATVWAAAHAASFDGDPDRIAIAGDSAGGNLAAAVAIMAKDRGGPDIAFQLLIYPCTDMDPQSWPSFSDNAEGYFLTRDAMRWFYGHYAADEHRTHPLASPIHAADLRGLPPALVITAEYDPLRDEGEAYAARLREAGVPADSVRFDGQIHGFFSMAAAIDRAKDAQAQAATALRGALGIH